MPLRLQAYELSTLTGTQVMLLVASETGHVYTYATKKLQPMIASETGKALIQSCLNAPGGNIHRYLFHFTWGFYNYSIPKLAVSW